MRKLTSIILVLIISAITSCSYSSGIGSNLDAKTFADKIKSTENAVVLDVRTASEFSEGHIANAINLDWNNKAVEAELKKLDPNKSYFVYCLSGGRSSSAAEFLKQNGFKNVFELNGGIMKWKAADLPLEGQTNIGSDEISFEKYESYLNNEKVVVIDIFAEWCGPCKKMAPYLNEMQVSMKEKVEIIRIDADKNPELCKKLNVDALPTVFVYKNKQRTFEHVGFLSKEDLVKEL